MIQATFKDGRKVKYSNAVVDSMRSDVDVVEVIDLETGEVLIDRNPLEQDRDILEIMIRLSPAIASMNRVSFMSMLGTILDSYGAENNYTSTETILMLEQLLDVQKCVHRMEGMMGCSK